MPLFLIDDLYVDPDAVRQFAFERSFPESQAYYPGRHQPLPSNDPSIRIFSDFMAKVLSHATGKPISGSAISTDFSILTTPENGLLGLQGQPHIDATPMLGVIYLNSADFGGTVFFRNKETGSMSVVTDEHREQYARITTRSDENPGDKRYITDSSGIWEKVDVIDGNKNRLVIWPGNVFHSIEVKVPPDLGKVEEKRLTQRVIVNRIGQ
ncbi:MAG: hypothetical protein KDI19_03640 [Pseudomonadales bacterium]|nr:hypothetical protein [Pseudomonadales bacterium]